MGIDLALLERKRIATGRGARPATPPPALAPDVRDLAIRVVLGAQRVGPCAICGGGGWVSAHDMACPLEQLAKALGMKTTKGNCVHCQAPFEIMFYAAPFHDDECSQCAFDRTAGKRSLETKARAAVADAKMYAANGKPKAAKRAARNAKRLMTLMKSSR